MNMLLDRTESLEIDLAKAIARTWLEPKFEQKLLHSPVAAFAELGLYFDSNVDVEIERGSETKYWVRKSGDRQVYCITIAPSPVELKSEDLTNSIENLDTPLPQPTTYCCRL